MAGGNARTPNLVLRYIREEERRESREEFAAAVVRTGRQLGDSHLACDARLVARWEDGEVGRPRAAYQRALVALTGRPFDQLGFRSAARPVLLAQRNAIEVPWPDDLSPARLSLQVNEESQSQATGGEDEHVRRRDFLALTGATLTALDILRSRAEDGVPGGSGTWRPAGRMDGETCEGLASLVLGYRQVYRSAGAASLLGPVCGTMNLLTELAPDSGQYRDRVISLIGQASTLAGAILMFDLDDFKAAKHYLALGARAAQQSADNEVMAIALASRAFHATYSGDTRAGVAFAEGALEVAADGIHPRSHGWVAAVASEMHATLGRGGEAACMAALETASQQLTRPMPERPWAGIGAFDAGKLAAYQGGDLVRLGKYQDAQVQLQSALDQLNPALVKHRCTAHIDLAEAYALGDEPEQAARHAASALEIISSTRHADSLRRVEDLYARITASGSAAARDLGSRLVEFKATS